METICQLKTLLVVYLLVLNCVTSQKTRDDKDDCDNYKNYWKYGAMAGGAVVAAGGVLAVPFLLGAVGFTGAGVTAGSIAASLQPPLVTSGSMFSMMQSIGAVGGLTATAAAGAVGGGAAVGYYAGSNVCEQTSTQG